MTGVILQWPDTCWSGTQLCRKRQETCTVRCAPAWCQGDNLILPVGSKLSAGQNGFLTNVWDRLT